MSILYNIIIAPIELIVEIFFEIIFRIVGQRQINQGITLIGVSLAISLTTLPLYRKADKIQRSAREKQKNMQGWINHIRKTFKGDERFMMLQAYYKLNDYTPISNLKSAFPLLLQIPFFTAAYHFLSHLQALQGASFGFITDLGKPDALIKIGSFSINLLPILMTTINCISSAVYLKGFPIKDKIQTYGMAFIFLILLYKSPSGLVVYWTCNNIFSLLKNIFYKFKNPRKILDILCATAGALLSITLIASGILNSIKKYIIIVFFFICTFIPLILSLVKKRFSKKNRILKSQNNNLNNSPVLFIITGIFLCILTGILIPSSVISSSPAEFIDLQNYRNPLFFILNSSFYSIGFFIFWSGIIRYMLPQKSKHIFDFILLLLLGMSLLNYMCFGKHFGVLSPLLAFNDDIYISTASKIINLLVLIVLAIVLFLTSRFKKVLTFIISVLIISSSLLSIFQISKTQKILHEMAYIKDSNFNTHSKKLFTLSKSGKNVIVFMLDRAISGYVPYIFEEKPQLVEQFSGFTYYPNTLSHGFYTNFGTPGLFGGYEYTPYEMNKRDTELLADKHNEALKVLPVLFSENNYDVTVCDPPYAGYNWIPDLSIYDDYPEIKTYITKGFIKNDSLKVNSDKSTILQNERNFFCYSLFRIMPLAFGIIFYDDGNYFSSAPSLLPENFFNEFSVLTKLADITEIINEDKNCYLSITNSTTHDPCILQLPDYELKISVDNSGYKTIAENYITMENENQISHYHTNVASLMALGNWFDFLRKNEVYDNTRIILVADHGRGLAQFDYMLLKDLELDVEWCNPLFMVKDFYSKTFSTSDKFMTNADVPTLATKDLIDKPINPFTGKIISDEEKNSQPQLITSSQHWDTEVYNGTTFDTKDGHWYSVKDNIFNENNWKLED